jgi:hypothetical protein
VTTTRDERTRCRAWKRRPWIASTVVAAAPERVVVALEGPAGPLSETTMDPAQRVLLQVTLEDAAAADEMFAVLMGEDVESRRSFIQRNAKDVRFLDI